MSGEVEELITKINLSINDTNDYEEIYDVISRLKYIIKQYSKEEIDKIILLKKNLIKEIIQIPKYKRKNERINTLKNIVNHLEELEVIYTHNIDITKDKEVILHMFINENSYYYIGSFIKNYPHLINEYNKNNYNILYILIEEFIRTLQTTKNYNFLYSYFNTIRILLATPKIKFKKEEIENAKCIIKQEIRNSMSLDKNIKKYLKSLISLLDRYQLTKSIDNLDKIFNISYIKNDLIDIQEYKKDLINDDYIVTFDCDSNCIKDDGITVNKRPFGYELKIFISDPLAIIKYDSIIMSYAKENCQTIPNKQMFPYDISKRYLSLEKGVFRNVRCYTILISNDKEVISYKINKEVVKVSDNYAYKQIDKVLKTSTNNKNLDILLNNLLMIKDVIKQEDISKDNTQSLVMHIANFLNCKTAEYFSEKSLPFVYCSNYKRFISLKKEQDNEVLEDVLKSLENETFYDTRPSDKISTQVTDPLRRYVDILANIAQDFLYFNKCSDYEKDLFEMFLNEELSYQMKRIKELKDYVELKNKIKEVRVLTRIKQD